MKFTSEMIEKAKTAKTAEELLEMAKAENVALTAEEAAAYFAKLHREGELADEELDNVAGGCGGYSTKEEALSKAIYKIGDIVLKLEGEWAVISYKCRVIGLEARFESGEWWVYYHLIYTDGKDAGWEYEGYLST